MFGSLGLPELLVILLIVVIIFGFQFLVLRRKPAHFNEILLGFLWVLVGLSLFLLGLELCLFPLGRLMAAQLTDPVFIQAHHHAAALGIFSPLRSASAPQSPSRR